MTKLAWLVPFLPLLGGLVAAVGRRRLRGNAHVPVIVGIALAFLVSLGLSIPGAAHLAASTPARRHGLEGRGTIEVGGAADLCVVDDAGRLQRVLQDGAWV